MTTTDGTISWKAGYLDRFTGPPSTYAVVYVLTEKGSAALCK